MTVQHRSRVAADPSQPDLRQVHLVQAELFDEPLDRGLGVRAGRFGGNTTTRDVELLALPRRARLRIGATAVVP